jgi:hypothetical protein
MKENLVTPRATHPRWELLAWGVLIVLIVALLPLFVCMPIWCDCYFFDEVARVLLQGQSFYRDTIYHNVPGMILLQASIRGAFGWRSETLRAVDFLIVSGIVWLLAGQVRLRGATRATSVWTAVVLFFFYFSTSEWCHCQPDVWMLLPALVALTLRQRQMGDRTTDDATRWRLERRSLVEGVFWGLAFVIKSLSE